MKKGICQQRQLKTAIDKAFQYSNTVRLETDMRAMMNPQRMQVIKALAIKLAKRIQQACPSCSTPGFGEVSTRGSLVCESCGTRTKLYRYKVLNCIKCDYQQSFLREDGLKKADPTYCPYCNP